MSPDAISLRRALCLAASLGIAVLAGIAHGKNVKPPLPDWQALAFTCTTEQNPPVDPQADAWFLRARELERQNIEAHDAEMVRLYQMAADRGHYKAMLNLAALYSRGIVVPRDEGKAVDLVEQAMKLGAPHAYYLMGVMLQQGIGLKQDKIAATTYFRKSADMGNRYGQAAIGEDLLRAFQQETGPVRERGKGIGRKALECALSQQLSDAGHILGMDYLIAENDVPVALSYFQKSASLGNEKSLWKLYSIFKGGKHGVLKDLERAACYYSLREQLEKDKNRRFPDIDRICPLPRQPSTAGASDQPSPRSGLWHQAGHPAVMVRMVAGDTLPRVEGTQVQWEWEAVPFEGSRVVSGQSCPWPGTWACEDLPIGGRHFNHGEPFPEVEGRPVTWRLMPRV
ncbi:sel1 repeat family protein [Pseudomonas aeruginosa]|nr:sel1 repeat family protein [Pseudomonas aeruginosa]